MSASRARAAPPRVPAPARVALGRLVFGPFARVYDALTDHAAWRASCRDLSELVPGPLVLDVGVGPGASALARPGDGRRHVGLDLSAAMIARAARAARRRGVHLPLVQGDALALPVRDGALDGVTAHSVLYLLPSPERALSEMRRALRPGGRVALLEPRAGPADPGALSARAPRVALSMLLWRGMSRLHRRFAEAELEALLAAAGFAAPRAWPVLGGFGVMATGEARSLSARRPE